ncbi:hypothetical protein JOB18_002184 [Solea senegalensis]|uniref:C2H2-type domain-containing protein n=1 Tax=Solea senegalensis TaxID=28829 RepID=A0AAV6PYX3_SOLSE|nr:hypothetical protein JOB18_002184 [Solea senegalensis]
MLTCYKCKVQHRNCSALFQHLKFSHALYPGRTLRLKCGEHGCPSVFYTYSGFKKHLLKVHGDSLARDIVDNMDCVGMDSVDMDSFCATEPLPGPDSSVSHQNLLKESSFVDMCSSVIAQVQAAGVAENTVQSLACSMEEVVNDVHIQAQDAVLECLSSEVNEQTLDKVKECLENLENPFSLLNTVTKRQRHFEKKWKIVEPVEHVLGVRYDTRLDKTTGVYSQVHKLGCVYFILRNLPTKLNSVLMNIHLVSLFHSDDIKKYGFSPILQPLVNDLKTLETQGIQVPFSDTPLRGSVVQVTGDNLALHGLFGMVESFSATYCCRFCLTDKTSLQSVFSEDDPDLILRTKELYLEHCNNMAQNPNLVHSFGVKKACPLNALQFFHSSDNYAVDIMHDLLEGVVQFELKLLFQYLVRNSIDKNTLSTNSEASFYDSLSQMY